MARGTSERKAYWQRYEEIRGHPVIPYILLWGCNEKSVWTLGDRYRVCFLDKYHNKTSIYAPAFKMKQLEAIIEAHNVNLMLGMSDEEYNKQLHSKV